MRNKESIIQPLKPSGREWIKSKRNVEEFTIGYPSVLWSTISGFLVISAVEVMDDGSDIDLGPQYHVSVSYQGHRCNRVQAKYVLKEFGMLDAEEDNHVPHGIVRNYFKPVAENLIGHECQCKKTETVMKEDKGDYIWRGINK